MGGYSVNTPGGGATIGGAILASEVAFGSAANTIAGDTEFQWDNVNKILRLGTVGVGTTSRVFIVDDTTIVAGARAAQQITVNANPAANSAASYIGEFCSLTNAGGGAIVYTSPSYLGGLFVATNDRAGSTISAVRTAGAIGRFTGGNGTTDSASGLRGEISSTGGGSSITEASALYAAPYIFTAGTIITANGLKVDPPGVGVTQWTAAIGTGNSHVAGSLSIGATTAPSSNLHVFGNTTITGETAIGNSAAYGSVAGVMRYSDTAWTITDFTAVNSWRVDSARFIVDPDADYAGDTATARFSQITIPDTNANDFGTLFANNAIADFSGTGVVTQNISGQSAARLDGAGTITTNVGHNVNVTGTSAAAGTVTNNYGVVITSGIANAGGTVTNDFQIVLRSPDITGTVTNSRAIYAEDHSVVTGGYFIYSEGGRSYHAGALAVGQNNFDITVGGSSIPTKLSIHNEGAATQSEIETHKYSDTAANGSIIHGARSRGSIAAPAIVQADDNLLDIVAVGYDGTDYAQAARIDVEVDGTPGANDMPGRFVIKTSPDGSQTPAEALRVDSRKSTIASGRVQTLKGADVASANDLTLGTDGNVFVITGNVQINAITIANWQAGSEIILIFSGAPTVKHNTAGGAGTAVLFLSGSVDLVAAANTVLKLVYDGTQWQEVSRKVA